MADIEKHVQDNYRRRAEEMGVDLAHLATIYEHRDPGLAAWMRSQATPEPVAAPKQRRAPTKADG